MLNTVEDTTALKGNIPVHRKIFPTLLGMSLGYYKHIVLLFQYLSQGPRTKGEQVQYPYIFFKIFCKAKTNYHQQSRSRYTGTKYTEPQREFLQRWLR